MSEENWSDYFDEDPDEEIGRNVEGIFGESILIVMPRISWAYIDWLETALKGNVKKIFIDCEAARTPEHGSRTEAYQNVVYQNYLKREMKGLSRPPWCAAADPDDFDELENLEK